MAKGKHKILGLLNKTWKGQAETSLDLESDN